MARNTGRAKSTSKSPTTPSDNPNPSATPSSALSPPSDSPNPSASATLSSPLLQETMSTPASNTAAKSKPNPKARSKVPVEKENRRTTVPTNTTALLARLAEREGTKNLLKVLIVADNNVNFYLAEIDRLRKASQSRAQDTKPKEIKRPQGSITNLQKAMGLEDDRALYMNCRVSFILHFFIIIFRFNISISILGNY